MRLELLLRLYPGGLCMVVRLQALPARDQNGCGAQVLGRVSDEIEGGRRGESDVRAVVFIAFHIREIISRGLRWSDFALRSHARSFNRFYPCQSNRPATSPPSSLRQLVS